MSCIGMEEAMLLAFDDTDSAEGGCTTYLAFSVLLSMPQLALGGMPRLVRLNPNWPGKTRGNGAVVLPLVHASGPQAQVGELLGHEIRAFPEGRPVTVAEARREGWLEAAWEKVQAEARPGARPGMAAFDLPPPAWAYGIGVTTRLEPETAQTAAGEGEVRGGWGEGGWIGAVAAAAWPGPPSSFEFIAYRSGVGTRRIESGGLAEMDAVGATFHSHDPEVDRPTCIPNTPCPVLCGLRGTDPEWLQRSAAVFLKEQCKEPVQGWLMWATNQASGDHVVPVEDLRAVPALATVRVRARVTGAPERLQGGHVRVPLADAAENRFVAMAFEPTGAFRDRVAALSHGDAVVVTGKVAHDAVHLERLDVIGLADATRRVVPVCGCGRSMKSRGRGAGYRCPSCKAEAEPGVHAVPRSLESGTHEVPVRARRHLHRPAAWD